MPRTFATEDDAYEFLRSEVRWGLAAGTSKNIDELTRFAQMGVPVVTFGSITPEFNEGNSGENFYQNRRTGDTINNLGIPNKGINAYLDELAAGREKIEAFGSKLMVSISPKGTTGSAADESYSMASKLSHCKAASIIQVNGSCPHLQGQKRPMVCFDRGPRQEVLHAVRLAASDLETSFKISTLNDPVMLEELAEDCVRYGFDWIDACNTSPNGYMEKLGGGPAIPKGRGGLAGGEFFHMMVRGIVQMLVPMLEGTKTKVWFTGGIDRGRRCHNALVDGARAFGFNSFFSGKLHRREEVFNQLLYGYRVGESEERRFGLLDILVQEGLPNWE